MERMPSGGKNLDERIVTVCSGLDLVNISYTNFVAASSEVASVSLVSFTINAALMFTISP